MKRVASLFLPSWPTDRLRRAMGANAPSLDVPLVLIGHEGRKRVVLAADTAARRVGLRPNMPVSKAQALVSGLQIVDADPAADLIGLEKLALWIQRRYAPLVASDPPDGLMIDITGSAHLFGGEAEMLKDIVRRLSAAGILPRIAVARTYGAAHALARYAANPVFAVDDDRLGKALALLPIAALRLPTETQTALRQLGFDRIEELAATPRAPLTLRLGPQLGQRLDQAFGRLSELFDPVTPTDRIEVRRAFAEPIGAAETLARYTATLVDALCSALETRGLGARKLDLLFFRVDNRIESIRVGTAKPVRDAKRLTRLLCDKLETVEPGFGVEAMTLSAPVAEPLAYRTSSSTLVDAPIPDVSELIDTLANRMGNRGQLYRLAPVESDVPERAARRVAPLAPATGRNWPQHWPRPSRLFDPPERIETVALLPDHPPVTFTWRGQRRRVRRADGPERLFGEWWKREAEKSAVRDYFQVEDDAGERYWLFRAGDGEDPATGSQDWFVHGIFG
jgi:protein ImuB